MPDITASGSMQLTAQWNKKNTEDQPLSTPTDNGSTNSNKTFTTGAGAGQIQAVHRDRVNIAGGGGTHQIDLRTSLAGSLGETIDFTGLLGFAVFNYGDETIEIGGNAAHFDFLSDPTATFDLGPSDGTIPSKMCWESNTAKVVTDSVNDVFLITNNGTNPVDVELVIYGQGTNT